MSRRGFLAERDPDAIEEMDRPDCDPGKLDRTYAQFGVVNAAVSGWRRTYTSLLRPAFSPDRTNTLLDVGSGGGDVPRALARWARRDGLPLEVTAIDPDERAYAYATTRPALPGLSFRRALSSELVAEGAAFDAVVSNHVLHHLDPAQFDGLLDDTEQLTRQVAVHSDIARHPLGYALFSAGTLPLPGSYIRQDGLTSIRRSYTPRELRDTVAGRRNWEVRTAAPFINLLVLQPGGPAGEPHRA
ncbi:methyltransferase domain-containing protein [Arthrobacter cheniae]|uniref:Methyltransferase domain-containing protein n=1 Tax=Arthrobacter cheniae TaxID=1258888 RepID=A0A3A5LYI2_9MICC|nr:class I SAM-dependent methyltransferase [Arthrobacter cheniae]RJT77314.1 methyltransferase domain-containing protein [Arthrobacter cheniae]